MVKLRFTHEEVLHGRDIIIFQIKLTIREMMSSGDWSEGIEASERTDPAPPGLAGH